MTTVLNLFGGPGSGKSTLAAELFSELKKRGSNVELVREYCKNWAWGDRAVNEWDYLYLLGKQSSYESLLYGKVDYLVTDSPFILAGIYQQVNTKGKHSYVLKAAKEFMQHAESNGVTYLNIYLHRGFPYDPRGRWENEEGAVAVDEAISDTLVNELWQEPIVIASGPRSHAALTILTILENKIESTE